MFTTAAYLASDYVLVPVVPQFISAIGFPLLARSLDEFKAQYDKDVQIAGIVFNSTTDDYSEHDTTKREVVAEAANNGWYVFEHEIGYSRSYPRGPRAATPIFLTDYARYSVEQAFRDVATEFFGRIGL
jgi:chromosome partitioning protein